MLSYILKWCIFRQLLPQNTATPLTPLTIKSSSYEYLTYTSQLLGWYGIYSSSIYYYYHKLFQTPDILVLVLIAAKTKIIFKKTSSFAIVRSLLFHLSSSLQRVRIQENISHPLNSIFHVSAAPYYFSNNLLFPNNFKKPEPHPGSAGSVEPERRYLGSMAPEKRTAEASPGSWR